MFEPGESVEDARTPLRLIMAALMTTLFLSELNETIFATALPRIVADLNGRTHMLWVGTIYLLSSTVVMPVYGMLSDRYGRRPLVLSALTIFVAGSVLGGLSGTFGGLLLGRAVQGLGGGGLLILIQAVLADLVPARQRPRYLTVVGAVFAASSLLGPVLGGWLTDGVGWRWAFWLNLPLGGAALLFLSLALRLPAGPPARAGRIDVAGIVVLSTGVTAGICAAAWAGTTYAWTSPVIGLLIVVVGVCLIAFVHIERRAADPLIPLSLFAHRNFAAPSVAGLVLSVAMFGTVSYLPTYLQIVHGLTPTWSGVVMLFLIIGLALGTVAAGRITTRTGRYRGLPVFGSVLAAGALAAMSSWQVTSSLVTVGACLFGLGAGIGLGLQTLLLVVQNAVPPPQVGIATATHNFLREIGVVFGTAVVGAAFTARLTGNNGPSDVIYQSALTPVFGGLVPLLLLGAAGLLLVRPLPLATVTPGRHLTPA